MKTFLLNIPKRLRIESQKLDAQASLCDKAWTVFNDEGVKQLFIFQPDGSLLITINGEVYNSTWKYLPVNNSVVITSEGKSTMFHPVFLDKIVFALEQDGGPECLFMIDEVNQKAFSPKSLTELGDYFDRAERALIAEEQRQKEIEARELEERRRRDAERIRKEKELAERRRKEEEYRKNKEANEAQKMFEARARKEQEDRVCMSLANDLIIRQNLRKIILPPGNAIGLALLGLFTFGIGVFCIITFVDNQLHYNGAIEDPGFLVFIPLFIILGGWSIHYSIKGKNNYFKILEIVEGFRQKRFGYVDPDGFRERHPEFFDKKK